MATYSYDGNGKRIKTVKADGTVEYAMYSVTGTLLYTDNPVADHIDYIQLGGKTVVQVDGGNPTYLHADLLGSPRMATNSGGGILWNEHYDPYGQKLNGVNEKIGYTGHAYDTETQLTYAQARFYDPAVGRFLSNNPVGFTGSPFSFNRYSYVNNSPYGGTDPTGMCSSLDRACDGGADSFEVGGAGLPGAKIDSSLSRAADNDLTAQIAGSADPSDGGNADHPLRSIIRDEVSAIESVELKDIPAMMIETLQALPAEGAAEAAILGAVGKATEIAGRAAPETARVIDLIATHGKTMSNKALDKLVKNIRTFGIKMPLTVTEYEGRLYILDGHHRALAAVHSRIVEVPINRVELPFGAYKTPADLDYVP